MMKREFGDKTDLVALGLLAWLNRPVSGSEIVNFVYLVDNRFYECAGRTLTGKAYIRDFDGPNDEDDSIIGVVNELADSGRLVRMPVSVSDGRGAFRHPVPDTVEALRDVAGLLNAGEYQIVRDVVKAYGGFDPDALAAVSKGTAAFANVKPYEPLRFKQSERAIELQKEIGETLASNPDFAEDVRLGLEDVDAGRWVWHEDLFKDDDGRADS